MFFTTIMFLKEMANLVYLENILIQKSKMFAS